VVDAADLVLVVEIRDLGVVPHEPETVAVEHEIARMRPSVVHGDAARVRRAAGAHVERAGPARVGVDRLAGIAEVIYRRLDRIRGGVLFDEMHAEPHGLKQNLMRPAPKLKGPRTKRGPPMHARSGVLGSPARGLTPAVRPSRSKRRGYCRSRAYRDSSY